MDSDGGMVGTWQPHHIETLHAFPASNDIRKGKAERMAHMKGTGDIGWRENHGKFRPAGINIGRIDTGFNPESGPFIFNWMRIINPG
jgi:hypothetical protein